jgi:tetratricopeptide (TPR) repeat protein
VILSRMLFKSGKGGMSQAHEPRGLESPRRKWIASLLIAGLIGVLYFNTLGHQFTNWDDGMIYQNPRIRNLNWEGIKKIFRLQKGETYQPVRMLSYAIDYKFWKLNPMGYRITNILFYILSSIIVFLALQHISTRLREGRGPNSHFRVGLFGALLFAAHPVHVEAVTWLSARKEVLQGFFFFLGFYLYLMGREKEGRQRTALFILVLLFILLATLSKPSAIVFPAVLLVYEIALRRNRWIDFVKRHWVFFSLSATLSFIFAFILIRVMLQAGGIKAYHGGTFFSNLIVSFYLFIHDIKLTLFTLNYSAAYATHVPSSLFHLQASLVVVAVFLLFGLSVWSLKKTKVIFLAVFFFFVTVLPYLNILPISTLLADRYVFIPSFSTCFLLGMGFDRLYYIFHPRFSDAFFKLLSLTLFLFLLGCYSFMTIQQNKIWENSYTLWSDAVEKYPGSNVANALMGVVYMDLGMDEKAAEYLEKAVQILPIDYESRNNLGIVYQKLNRPERAFQELMIALSLKPEDEILKINLSLYYQNQKEYEKSEAILKNLLSKSPKNVRLLYRLGILYKEMGDYEGAIAELKKAIELAPGIITLYEELGNIYISRMKDIEKGKFYYQKGIEMVPKAKPMVEDLKWMIQDLECHR